MNDWAGLAWLGVLLMVNAFFVGAEFAVISARRSQIEPRAEAGSRAAKTALWAMEHATLMLATCQLGITIASLLILNVSEPAIHHLLEVPLELTHLPEEVIGTIAFVITLIVVSFLHVVIGEMVPKNLSFSVPDRAVLILATPLVFFALALATAGLTNSPEHAQVTTLPISLVVIAVSSWVGITGTEDFALLKRVLPGGSATQLIINAWNGGVPVVESLPLLATTWGWVVVAVALARRYFRWEPRR
jgi:hypothetical protein